MHLVQCPFIIDSNGLWMGEAGDLGIKFEKWASYIYVLLNNNMYGEQ